MSSTNPNPTAATPASSSSSNRPPVTLTSTTHLDPGAYVRGTHPITFGEHNLVHPRVLLTTTTHPITFGTNNVISEKAIIGGSPSSTPSTTPSSTANPTISSPDPSSSLSQPPTPLLPSISSPNASTSQFTNPTTFHSYIHIHPAAQISHSATIHNYAVIESHAIIHPGVSVGAHSKICANVAVTRDVPEWTVVYGEGNARRSRRPVMRAGRAEENGEGGGAEDKAVAMLWQRIEEAEMVRVKNTDREREGTSIMLRNAARAAVAAKRQSMQR